LAKINPPDDSTTVALMLEADSGTSTWGEPVKLVLECESKVPNLYIVWDDYLGMDEVPVLMRIGTDRARWLKWPLSTDWEATFYPRSFYTILQ
jgi:type VI secretion system protein VasI